jgi:hypothetical protein
MPTEDADGAILINAVLSQILTFRTTASNDSPTSSDVVLLCSATLTVSLPAVAANSGMGLFIKNIGVGTVTVDANGSELIDGQLTQLLNPNDTMFIMSDAAQWRVL